MRGNRNIYNKDFDSIGIDLKLRKRREWNLSSAIRANKPDPRR
jgi:hypothetical protein